MKGALLAWPLNDLNGRQENSSESSWLCRSISLCENNWRIVQVKIHRNISAVHIEYLLGRFIQSSPHMHPYSQPRRRSAEKPSKTEDGTISHSPLSDDIQDTAGCSSKETSSGRRSITSLSTASSNSITEHLGNVYTSAQTVWKNAKRIYRDSWRNPIIRDRGLALQDLHYKSHHIMPKELLEEKELVLL